MKPQCGHEVAASSCSSWSMKVAVSSSGLEKFTAGCNLRPPLQQAHLQPAAFKSSSDIFDPSSLRPPAQTKPQCGHEVAASSCSSWSMKVAASSSGLEKFAASCNLRPPPQQAHLQPAAFKSSSDIFDPSSLRPPAQMKPQCGHEVAASSCTSWL